jgi:hypothetical protein
MITLFRRRAARGSWVCCGRPSWVATRWRQVSSDLLCPTYFIIHCPALFYLKPKDWLVCIYFILVYLWVIMISFMLLLYLNKRTWCEYLWYDDVVSMMILWYFRWLAVLLSTSPLGPVRWVTTWDNSTTMRVECDTLSWIIRWTWGVVGFAGGPSMGAGHSGHSAKGGCRCSFDLVLLVTHLREGYYVCTTGET